MKHSPIKIGFDISQTGKAKVGCGFFAENLIYHLAFHDSKNDYSLYPTFGDHYWDNHYHETAQFKLPNFQHGLAHKSLTEAKQFWHNPPLDLEEQLGSVDILHSNNYFCPPKMQDTKIVYTLYDLSFLEHPECTTEHNRIACFEGVFKASLNADFIIAISEYSRQHFLQTFPHYPAEKTAVVYPASRFANDIIEPKKTKKLAKLHTHQFWLCVGTIEPRKNIKRLLFAYAQLKATQKTVLPLVFAGGKGWLAEDFEQIINALGLQQDVRLLGYVENPELMWLYQHCFCLVYPTLFEGFGLPILEAMGLGAPVITSKVSSIPEVIGDAGILIDPLQESELVDAMLKITMNEEYRQDLIKRGLERAKLFSWDNAAKEVLSLYQRIFEQPAKIEQGTAVSPCVATP